VSKNILNIAGTTAEAKSILDHKEILVNGIRRKSHKFMIGLFDTISLPTKEHYRILLNTKGKFFALKISESESRLKPHKILMKRMIGKAMVQLNLSSGRNLRLERTKDTYSVGDTLIIKLPEPEIVQHLKLEKNCLLYMTAGTHIGALGSLQEIRGHEIIFRSIGKEPRAYETLKEYAFVIGKEKAAIALSKENERQSNEKIKD